MIRSLIRTLLPQDRTEAIVAFVIALVGAAFYHPGQWNQNARLAATAAFVEPGTPYTGTFRIDGLFSTPRFRTGDWARSEGRLYSNKAPGTTFMAVVPYFLLYHGEKLAGLDPTEVALSNRNAFLLNLCISVFWNVVAALALLRTLPRVGLQSQRGAALVTAVYAFATLVLPYGGSLWGHSTAAAFLTLGTLALFDGSLRGSTLAGWWLGLALLTEYFAALSLGLGGLFLLVVPRADRLRHVVRFVLGSALPVGALLIFQKVCFGGFLTTASGASNPAMLDPSKFAGQFGVPSWTNLVQLYFSSQRGILLHMPVLVLAAVGLVWWLRTGKRWCAALAAANIAGYSLAVSAMTTTWHGGVTTSSRYLIVALPFFCLLLPHLDAVPLRGAFVVLLAVSASNMFVVAATSTMLAGASPIYGVAYPQFWRGEIAFNPLLSAAGVAGLVPALLVALTLAAGLTWIVRAGLPAREKAVPEAVAERLSKRLVLASLVGAVAWMVWQTQSPSLTALTGAAAIGGLAIGESRPLAGAAVLLLLAYLLPPPYSLLWTAALAALLARDQAQSGWTYPARWRPPLVLWALTIAIGWPLVALRELDFEWPGLLARYAVRNTATGSTPAAVIATIAGTAAVHLLGLLWLDWLFRRFASSRHREAERWILWPLAISAIAGCAFALLQNRSAGFAVIASCWSAGLLAFGAGTRLRIIGLVGTLLCWSVVLISGSRIALVAAAAAAAGAGTGVLYWRRFPVISTPAAGAAVSGAIPAASIASQPLAGVGIGMSTVHGWWRQSFAELGLLGAAGIIVATGSLVAVLLRGRPDAPRRLAAAAVFGALLGAAVASAVAGQGLLMAVTAGTFVFLLVNLVNRDTADGAVVRLAWVGVAVLLVAFLGATMIAARGDQRVPRRAVRGGWPYSYGMYPAPAAAPDGAFRTERHGVSVVTVHGPSMILTIRAEHPDIREHPVSARVDVDGHTIISTRLHTNDPLVRSIDLGGTERVVIETRVDRTWRDPARAGDPREIGLSMSLKFAGP